MTNRTGKSTRPISKLDIVSRISSKQVHMGSKLSPFQKFHAIVIPPSVTLPCLFKLKSADLFRTMMVSAEHNNTDSTVTSVYIYITFFQSLWHFLLLSEKTQKDPPNSQPLNDYMLFTYKEVLHNYIISTSNFSFTSETKICLCIA